MSDWDDLLCAAPALDAPERPDWNRRLDQALRAEAARLAALPDAAAKETAAGSTPAAAGPMLMPSTDQPA